MNKLFTIMLSTLFVLLVGCAYSPPDSSGSQGQVYSNRINGIYHVGRAEEAIPRAHAEHAIYVPQNNSYEVEWVKLEGREPFRGLCTVTIRPGGYLTAGGYPCFGVKAVEDNRRFSYLDPVHGKMELSLADLNAGYLQSGTCDSTMWQGKSGEAYHVIMSTHRTRDTGGRGIFGALRKLAKDMQRGMGCVDAPKDMVADARRDYQRQQSLAQAAERHEDAILRKKRLAELQAIR